MEFSSDTIEDLRVIQSEFAKERNWDQYHTPRNLLLALVGEVGELTEMFNDKENISNVSNWTVDDKIHLGEELSDVFLYLMRLSEKCFVDLPTVTLKRIQHLSNAEVCDGKESKSKVTNVDEQSLQKRLKLENEFQFTKSTLESLRLQLVKCKELKYLQNIVLSIVTEVGQLAELFQWKGEVSVGILDWDIKEKENLGCELGDVLLNLILLSHSCCIDLPAAIKKKIVKNGMKYPVKLVHGSSKKYTEYKEEKGKLVIS